MIILDFEYRSIIIYANAFFSIFLVNVCTYFSSDSLHLQDTIFICEMLEVHPNFKFHDFNGVFVVDLRQVQYSLNAFSVSSNTLHCLSKNDSYFSNGFARTFKFVLELVEFRRAKHRKTQSFSIWVSVQRIRRTSVIT